jgi:UPF0755 protein
MMNKKFSLAAIIFLIIICAAVYIYIKPLFQPAIQTGPESSYSLFIPSGSDFEDVVNILKQDNVLIHEAGFRKVAGLLGYNKESVPPGKYILTHDMNTKDVISKLRSGDQNAVNVVINNVRKIEDLAGKISNYIEADSLQILEYFLNPSVQKTYNVNTETLLTLFIPNTYQLFWTTKPEKLLERMKKEHDKFWTQDKLDKIKSNGLSPIQAYILASIVEKESNYIPERPAIAGVYLNRLANGMKLQADPTVVFAMGQYDLKRVLFSHLDMDSPYNTYKYEGLPPGPIYMPSISSLEAVISADKHDYVFFCAKADNSGQHVFAVTYEEHTRNARKFSDWMNVMGIK